ncbi:hypothetical protein TNCV_1498501 [Trichonephila clavipes]|nr:hypothetical protein TNCV_1498501 [Trichonephila clavipes]
MRLDEYSGMQEECVFGSRVSVDGFLPAMLDLKPYIVLCNMNESGVSLNNHCLQSENNLMCIQQKCRVIS